MNKISCISYFNPCSSQFHSIKNFKKLNICQKIVTVLLTAFSSLFSVGILSVYTFRSLVGRMSSKVKSSTADKTHGVAKTKLKTPEKGTEADPKTPKKSVDDVQIQLPNTLFVKKDVNKTNEAPALEKVDIKPMSVDEMRTNLKLVNEQYQKISAEFKKRGWVGNDEDLSVYRGNIDSLVDPLSKPQDTEGDNPYFNNGIGRWTEVVSGFEHIFDHFYQTATYLEIKENDPISKQFLEIRNLMKPVLMNLMPVLYNLDDYSYKKAIELIGKKKDNSYRNMEVIGNDEKLADALIVHFIEKILELEFTESSNRKLGQLIERISDRSLAKTYALKIFNKHAANGNLDEALAIHGGCKLARKHLAVLNPMIIDLVNKHLEHNPQEKEEDGRVVMDEDETNNQVRSVPNLDETIEFIKNITDEKLAKEYGLKLFNKQVAQKDLDAALRVHQQLDLPKEHLAALDSLRVEAIKVYIANHTQTNVVENNTYFGQPRPIEYVNQLSDKKLAKEYGLKLFEVCLNNGDVYAVENLHRYLFESVLSQKYQTTFDQAIVNYIEKNLANEDQTNSNFEVDLLHLIKNKTLKQKLGLRIFEKLLADNKLAAAIRMHQNLGLNVQPLIVALESPTLSPEDRQKLIEVVENSRQQSYSVDQFLIKLANDHFLQNDKDSALEKVQNIFKPSDALHDLMKRLFNAFLQEKNLEGASKCISGISESSKIESIEKLITECLSTGNLDVASKCLDRNSYLREGLEKFQFQLAEAYLAKNDNESAMRRMKPISAKENLEAKKVLFNKIATALKAEGKITIVQKAARENYFMSEKQVLEELGIEHNRHIGW